LILKKFKENKREQFENNQSKLARGIKSGFEIEKNRYFQKCCLELCWGEGEDVTLRSMPSPASLHQRRQDD
jgi:hypothetical protein